jgi:hypothetical protein
MLTNNYIQIVKFYGIGKEKAEGKEEDRDSKKICIKCAHCSRCDEKEKAEKAKGDLKKDINLEVDYLNIQMFIIIFMSMLISNLTIWLYLSTKKI